MDYRLTLLDFETSLRAVTSMVFPRRCLACGAVLNLSEEGLCLCCSADMPYTRFGEWRRNPMADRFNAAIEAGAAEERAGALAAPGYEDAAALFHYRAGYKNITRSLKYARNFRGGGRYAVELGRMLAAAPQYRDVDVIVPVPLHWTRVVSRGYNQAATIAAGVARAFPSSAVVPLLRRCRRTHSQARLEAGRKAGNVEGAFAVREGPAAAVSGRSHILLVDDVFTTGATLSECYMALREAFGRDVKISAATLAFAG